ncbi:MAG: SDR family NAD(P)-dependent oxidoreductase [Saprospiraceae bacterium]
MFQQKNIAIVGASSGIGLALAQRLQDAGANLWTYSRRRPQGLAPQIFWAETDVLTPEFELPELPDQLHGIAYCPGSINLKPFGRISRTDLQREMEINFLGAFRVLQLAFPKLKAAQGAVVLFSTVAVQTGMPFHSSIAACKGAVEGLTRALAAEWAPTVRVNAIAPSLTDTPLAAALLSNDEKRQNAAARHPLKIVGTPEQLASLAAYLLSEHAAFVTGQIIHADGGIGSLKTS